MLTLFTIPKAFTGLTGTLQRNALRSWKRSIPGCEIILFGDDPGVAESAADFQVAHMPQIDKNEFGTPLLSSAFASAQQRAKHGLLMYVNADIIILPGLADAVRRIDRERFLACGQRWDLDVTSLLDFAGDDWSDRLIQQVRRSGALHGPAGIDYFIFPRGLVNMPPFAVGRPGWDSWLIYSMRSHKVPVINATRSISIIHQNHDYSHSRFGEKRQVGGPEKRKNILIAGGRANMATLRDADWILTESGLERPRALRRIFSSLTTCYLWRLMLLLKRSLFDVLSKS